MNPASGYGRTADRVLVDLRWLRIGPSELVDLDWDWPPRVLNDWTVG